MGITRREEDAADKWLREHDPYYTDSSRHKKEKYHTYYETPEQEYRRRCAEIPISNLNMKQRVEFSMVAGAFSEDGEFEL